MKTRLKELRMEKGYSQLALATRLEISQSTISKLESGTFLPNADILCRYSRFFHVSIDYILFQSNEKVRADDLLIVNPSLKANQRFVQCLSSMTKLQLMKLGEFLDTLSISLEQTEES